MCGKKPAPIVRNNKRRRKLSLFQGEHKAVRMSKAKKTDTEERLVVISWAVASTFEFILRTVGYQDLSPKVLNKATISHSYLKWVSVTAV